MTNGNGNTALQTISEYDGLVMVVAPLEALKRVQELQAFVKTVMKAGVDYGVIPGTGGKPSLFQPGAQKLCEIYGFAVEYANVDGSILDWQTPLFFFRKRCILTSRRDGRFVCDGVGSCNSREDRYAYRWVSERDIPRGMDKSSLRSRTKGKRGEEYTQYRLPNDDIYSLVNTMEKMAAKRALVHATLNATRSSGQFTQDVEDLPREAFGAEDKHRSWDRAGEPPMESAKPTAKDSMPEDHKALHDWIGARIACARVIEDLVALKAPFLRLKESERADLREPWTERQRAIQFGEVPDAEPESVEQPTTEGSAKADAAHD
jgi:hypothetical protein